jgi:amino-acid N-acetyltransferase
VIAVGGEVLQGPGANSLVQDCNLLAALGIKLVLVVGARPQIEEELAARGLEPRYHKGLRVTDAPCDGLREAGQRLDPHRCRSPVFAGAAQYADGRQHHRSGVGNFLTARPVGVVDGIDHGYTGTVRKVDVEALNDALVDADIVLMQPYGYSLTGEVFNLCMEEVAESVAIALQAIKLIYLCDAPGIVDESGELVPELTADEASEWLGAGRGITEDLGLYLPRAIRAVKLGVARVHMIDRDLDGALLLEFFTTQGVGSVISRERLARMRNARMDDVPAVAGLIAPLEADGTLVSRGRERLEREIERFSVLEHDEVIMGCAAFYPYAEDEMAELACLAVMPEYRRHGYGEQILSYVEGRARAERMKRLFVLTTVTAHWFVERGFVEAGVDALPRVRRENYNPQRRSKVSGEGSLNTLSPR